MLRLSKSNLEDWDKMQEGKYCPKKWKLKYIDRIEPTFEEEQGNAAMLGNIFEYLCTQYKSTDLNTDLIFTSTGKASAKGKIMDAQVDLYRELLKKYNVEILSVGEKLEFEDIDHTVVVVIDIIALVDGEKTMIDLKYTSKLHDDGEYGWSPEGLAERKHMRQAKTYVDVYEQVHGERLPFMFWVFSSVVEGDYAIFDVDISEEAITMQRQEYVDVALSVQSRLDGEGFDATPSFPVCMACEFRDKCESAKTTNEIIKITI